jgi:two-component system nitrogen regulation response regulator GlnG
MSTTHPIGPSSFQVKRFHAEVLSGPQRGVKREADADGRLFIGRQAPDAEPAPSAGPWLWLTDPMVSQVHLTLEACPSYVSVRESSRNGTWLGGARLCGQTFEVSQSIDLRVGETDVRVVVEARERTVPSTLATSFGSLLGTSPTMQRLFARIERLAACDLPVLITGESGTGKSVLAHAMHLRSRRASKEFMEIDFGAMSSNLMASELFGHVKGAYTDAVDRKGMFEEANGGTVFLDEIGDLALEHQPRLLRVLDRKRVRRMGSNEERAVNVRVIAATCQDLATMVNASRFRLDLYERLAVCTVEMPPLRERRDEIPALARHLIARIRAEGNVDVPDDYALSAEDERELMRREWPGNIRELYHYLAFKLATGERPPLRRSRPAMSNGVVDIDDLLDRTHKDASEELMMRFERIFLRHHYERTGYKLGKAAEQAGLHRVTFAQKMEKCGLKKALNGSDEPSD